jgi:hypothetical protein
VAYALAYVKDWREAEHGCLAPIEDAFTVRLRIVRDGREIGSELAVVTAVADCLYRLSPAVPATMGLNAGPPVEDNPVDIERTSIFFQS